MFFQGGPGPLPPPPLDQCMQYFAVKKISYEKKLTILTPPPPLGIPKCIHGVWENGERTKAHWDKSPLGQKPTGQYPTGQKPTA